ncbi:spore-associated protein A [Streptomyces sp. NBC_01622]|uniref:spore-associated protein A n=1 Tax=Streptomyces sp. NBC_01622 TaxID=2975903 RepID=UPI003869E0AA|nr:spore-associated protein A [Streptomyces sp. NBC_01622]
MKLSRRTTTAAALATLALGGTIAATAPASAATTKAATTKAAAATATYNGACGTGYKVIDSTPVGNVGKVFLTWNESTGKNCAVTIRNTPGAKIYMDVKLDVFSDQETTPAEDSGLYTSYAGPVYVNGRGHCITWSGAISTATGGDSGHCG